LLTGSTGALGTYLLPELLADGHEVVALTHRKLPRADSPGVTVVPGDITKDDLGMIGVCKVDAVVHAAALTLFQRRHAQALKRTNVLATCNVALWARRRGVPLYHVSTAFVCGSYQGTFYPQQLDVGQAHRNEYERTKYEAECVLTACDGLDYTVLRPSVLAGDTKVSGIPPLGGLYAGVRAVYLTKERIERSMGLPAMEPTIRLRAVPEATLNIIPVDIVARQIADIVDNGARGTYHLVNQAPPTVAEILAAVGRAIGADIQPVISFDANLAERLAVRMLGNLLPYLQGEPHFDCASTSLVSSASCDGVPNDFLEETVRKFLAVDSGGVK